MSSVVVVRDCLWGIFLNFILVCLVRERQFVLRWLVFICHLCFCHFMRVFICVIIIIGDFAVGFCCP